MVTVNGESQADVFGSGPTAGIIFIQATGYVEGVPDYVGVRRYMVENEPLPVVKVEPFYIQNQRRCKKGRRSKY